MGFTVSGTATVDRDTGIYSFFGRLSSDGFWHVISLDTANGSLVSAPAIGTSSNALINFEYGFSAAVETPAPGGLLLMVPGLVALVLPGRRKVEAAA